MLFEEVLSRLHHGKEEEEVQSPESFTSETSFVQDAFDNSKPLSSLRALLKACYVML